MLLLLAVDVWWEKEISVFGERVVEKQRNKNLDLIVLFSFDKQTSGLHLFEEEETENKVVENKN